MKKLKFYSLFVITAAVLFSFISDCDNIRWGTKSLYTPLQSEYSNVPDGYKPVFINYVGRHGARHLTKNTSDSLLTLVLSRAQSEDGLTAKGLKLRDMLMRLSAIEKGNYGSISEIGKQEQAAIGQRLANRFSAVFAADSLTIKVSTTKKIRTQQSANAFLKGLNLSSARSVVNNFNDGDNLAFYDVAPAYKSFEDEGSWKANLNTIKNSPNSLKLYNHLPTLFFKPSFVNKLDSNLLKLDLTDEASIYKMDDFMDAYYGICSIVASLDKEIAQAGYTKSELDFGSLISRSDLEQFDLINSAEDFLLKGPGTDASGIQVRIAAPLLLDFIVSTDEFFASNNLKANLRFAHAETIAPFAALLNIKGACESVASSDILHYRKVWKCEEVVPLSANIQWIIYKNNATNELLVKFMLNEKEVEISGLNNCGRAFYYRWQDVKEFYLHKLEVLNVNVGDDMHSYLLQVK